MVLHDQENANTPEFPVGLGGSAIEVGVCVHHYVACWFFLLWAKSVDCSEGIRAPGVRCCVSDEKIHLWKKTQQNVTHGTYSQVLSRMCCQFNYFEKGG